MALATVSERGPPTHLGFGMLAVWWLFTGLAAYRLVRSGNTVAHRQWMIHNFALTVAAVGLRNYLPLMPFALHWSARQSYSTGISIAPRCFSFAAIYSRNEFL